MEAQQGSAARVGLVRGQHLEPHQPVLQLKGHHALEGAVVWGMWPQAVPLHDHHLRLRLPCKKAKCGSQSVNQLDQFFPASQILLQEDFPILVHARPEGPQQAANLEVLSWAAGGWSQMGSLIPWKGQLGAACPGEMGQLPALSNRGCFPSVPEPATGTPPLNTS